jgi:hypothetical protein
LPSDTGDDLDVAVADQLHHAFLLAQVVLHQQHALDLLAQLRFEPREHVLQLLARRRLAGIADRAQVHRGLDPVFDRDHVHRHVAGARVFLQLLQHRQAGVVGQPHVQQHRVGHVLQRQRHALVGLVRHQAAVAEFVRQVEQDAGKGSSSSTTSTVRRLPAGALRSSAKAGARGSWRLPAGAGAAGADARDGASGLAGCALRAASGGSMPATAARWRPCIPAARSA